MDSYAEKLYMSDPLQEPIVRSAIELLALQPGSRGLDAGCGVGLQALLLAEAVGPHGHVTGLDISAELLTHAEQNARRAGMSERVSFREGDVRRLPFDDATFDWAWSASCVGYAPMEPVPLVRELARVVRPGGTVAILAWSSEQLLPGYPLLEARLDATAPGIAPFARGMRPDRHFVRALGWFQEIGLRNPTAHTLTGQAQAPLSEAMRKALEALLEMRWPGAESELSQEDRREYDRLCNPNSPDFILKLPDYYALFTCSMFAGTVAR